MKINSNDTKEEEVTLNQSEEIPMDDHLDSKFTNEWVQKMSDYESTYVYMIPVPYKSSQVFYENITTVPARLRGAFIVAEATKEKIEFKIKGPKGNTLYSNVTNAAIFELNVTEQGLYEINFNNRYKNSELRPTFTMNPGQNEILKKKDINQTEEKLDQLISFLKNFGTKKNRREKQPSHRHSRQLLFTGNHTTIPRRICESYRQLPRVYQILERPQYTFQFHRHLCKHLQLSKKDSKL